MEAIGYIRVSTEEQAREGISLDAQKARITAHCLAHGLTLDPAQICADRGISGKRADNRPGLAKALDLVCAKGCVLVTYSLSRIARSTRDTLAIAERLERAGADLVSLTESIDTTSAAGKMVFRLLAVLAEFERDLIAERTRAGLSHKRQLGERIGTVPIGKQVAGDGKRLEDCLKEIAAIHRIQFLRASGLGARSIARVLNLEGFTARRGPWNESTVRKILARKTK